MIYGTPEVSGDFNVTVIALNAFEATSRDFTLTITENQRPFFVMPPNSYTMQRGFYFSRSFRFLAKSPATITAKGTLPNGITIESDDATITFSGTPTETGTYNITINISNDTDIISRDIPITVTEPTVITTNFLPDAMKGIALNIPYELIDSF